MIRIRSLLALALLGGSSALLAQQPPADYSKVQIRTTRLADNFHTLEGINGPVIGTVLMLSGPDGVLLVDGQFAQVNDKLMAAIRKISDKPVRFLVNTHVHSDHTSGNESFAKQGAVIFSRDQLRWRMAHPNPSANGQPGRPAAALALPVVTYDNQVTIHLNGEDVQLIPIRAAHTDGDTLIYFPTVDVLATGDYFRTEGYPRVDRRGGGSLVGLLAGLGETIGKAGPKTRVVPGHGPVTDRNGLIEQRDMIIAMRDRIAPLVKQGKTIEEVLATKPTAEFDAKVRQGEEETTEQFVRWLYAELQAAG
jgi:glyoxylase-like metal-dependent hydrolase (beta-lactamase superfamily II)